MAFSELTWTLRRLAIGLAASPQPEATKVDDFSIS